MTRERPSLTRVIGRRSLTAAVVNGVIGGDARILLAVMAAGALVRQADMLARQHPQAVRRP